jgi:hypothetical protein
MTISHYRDNHRGLMWNRPALAINTWRRNRTDMNRRWQQCKTILYEWQVHCFYSLLKQPSFYSLLGRWSQAGKKGGSHYSHTNEGKQIHSSSSNQEELATFQGRIKAIANQLSPANASFIKDVFCCMSNKGGDVIRHLIGEVAAASEQAEETETREAELVNQRLSISDCASRRRR